METDQGSPYRHSIKSPYNSAAPNMRNPGQRSYLVRKVPNKKFTKQRMSETLEKDYQENQEFLKKTRINREKRLVV